MAQEGTVSARVSKRWRRRRQQQTIICRLRLHILRGNSHTPDHDALPLAGGGSSSSDAIICMDAKVWSRMPEEILWHVVVMVPAVKRFQFQVVSRGWRKELTSTKFRRAVAAYERQQQRGGVGQGHHSSSSLVACLALGSATKDRDTEEESQRVRVMNMNLSFVPRGRSLSGSYAVMAAGDGLVCVADSNLARATHFCVLNPVTQTLKVVRKAPFPPRRGLGLDLKLHLHAGALTVVATSAIATFSVWDWALAWYNLEADGNGDEHWTVAHGPGRLPPHPSSARTQWSAPLRPAHFVACGREWYCYRNHTLYVHAAGSPADEESGAGAGYGLVVTAQVEAPRRGCGLHDPSSMLLYSDADVFVVAHWGRVFFIALVDVVDVSARVLPTSTSQWSATKSCHVWVLARHSMEWREVGTALDGLQLHSLTRFKYANATLACASSAFAASDLLCVELRFERSFFSLGSGTSRQPLQVMVGLNLVTLKWELVHDQPWLEGAIALELRPSLFLF